MEIRKDVFVIMPFSSTPSCTEEKWSEIYENVFKPAIEECGYSCERAVAMTGRLTRSIVEKLRYARIVLADITDRNPNVFYELGVRHSLSKRSIVVAQGNEHTPSDLLGYWYISYGTSPGQVTHFKKEIKRLLHEIESQPNKSDNPVSDYLEEENLVISSYVQRENIKKLGALFTEFSGNVIQLKAMSQATEVARYIPSDISYNCLNLLLQTLYIDIGPELLKNAYELQYRLRSIEQGFKTKEFLQTTIDDLNNLSIEILRIRDRLISGEYSEPSSVSTMVWKPAANKSFLEYSTLLESVSRICAPISMQRTHRPWPVTSAATRFSQKQLRNNPFSDETAYRGNLLMYDDVLSVERDENYTSGVPKCDSLRNYIELLVSCANLGPEEKFETSLDDLFDGTGKHAANRTSAAQKKKERTDVSSRTSQYMSRRGKELLSYDQRKPFSGKAHKRNQGNRQTNDKL